MQRKKWLVFCQCFSFPMLPPETIHVTFVKLHYGLSYLRSFLLSVGQLQLIKFACLCLSLFLYSGLSWSIHLLLNEFKMVWWFRFAQCAFGKVGFFVSSFFFFEKEREQFLFQSLCILALFNSSLDFDFFLPEFINKHPALCWGILFQLSENLKSSLFPPFLSSCQSRTV